MGEPMGEDVEVDWARARDANRLNWGDRAGLHERFYGLDKYDDPAFVSEVVADDLPVLCEHLPGRTLRELDLAHLQCHIGTDTISLSRCGARVTGVDFSPEALDAARRLAEHCGASITWVESDVLDARATVQGDFDVVYTSIGTVCWLDDLDRWARQVAGLLRPGGIFYIRDGHPMLYALDETMDDLRLRYRYFADGRAQRWDDESTYCGDGKVEHSVSYEWPHPLSQIVTSLLAAGLVLERFDEGDTLPWPFAPRMTEVAPERYAWPKSERALVPCTYTLVARRPADA